MTKKAPEGLWPETDYLLQIGRDLSSQGKHDVQVFTELGSKAADFCFRWRRDMVPLDFTQVGRLDADPLRDLAKREAPVLPAQLLACRAEMVAKGHHVDCVGHTT